MRPPVSCAMIIAGLALMIIPIAVILIFAHSVKKLDGTFSPWLFFLHGLFCTFVGVVLVAVGAAKARE
jgi:hypothetical protein